MENERLNLLLEQREQIEQRGGSLKRSSSFMKSGFASLAQNQDDENELNHFFTGNKQYVILSSAGKPLYSR